MKKLFMSPELLIEKLESATDIMDDWGSKIDPLPGQGSPTNEEPSAFGLGID